MSTETTIQVQNAYTYKGGKPNPWADSLDALRSYVARAQEWGNDPADYKIITRTLVIEATPWREVK